MIDTLPSRLSEQLREVIEEEIATGQRAPGSRLDEVELAAKFSVSRTPIREALRLLSGEGLVETLPRRGTVVTQVTPQRLVEMFEVMAELEAMCARLAARRMTNEDMAAIEETHKACGEAAKASDTDAYYYANERFHYSIYSASRNSFLIEEALALQRKLRPYRRLQLRVRNRVQRSFAEHEHILKALRAGDAEDAVRTVRAHVLVQGERFADLIASLSHITAPTASVKTFPLPLVERRAAAGINRVTAHKKSAGSHR